MNDDPHMARLRAVVIGDLGPTTITLAEPDPAWPARYAEVETRIRAALGERALRVEHIGSTSVSGLAAKPIVDDPADEDAYLPALQAAGYELRVREPNFDEHRMLRTSEHDVHVHVFAEWSVEVARYLSLRDHLRSDASARQRYESRKRELAGRRWPTMDHYAVAKTGVIEALIAEAGGPARPDA